MSKTKNVGYFANSGQVKNNTDNKTPLGETGCLSNFVSPALRPMKVSTSSELYPDKRLFLFLFECLGIEFFNLHSHVTYRTTCHAGGHSHSCLGKWKISLGVAIILDLCLSSHQFTMILKLYLKLKILLVVKTVIKNIRQQPHYSAVMNQKIKIIAPSKNSFQNMRALQNCFLKKCISKLMSLKYTFHKWAYIRKYFLQMSINKNIFTNKKGLKRFS